jgi:hypothetical protein
VLHPLFRHLSHNQSQETVVEYVDEYGRTRTGPASEIPAHLRPSDGEEDPMVEYEDEFGRIRTVPRSEVPRQFLKKADEIPEDE